METDDAKAHGPILMFFSLICNKKVYGLLSQVRNRPLYEKAHFSSNSSFSSVATKEKYDQVQIVP